MSYKFRNVHRKTPVLESLINNVANLQACNFIRETPTHVFSCEYCKIFKNNFSFRTPLVTASLLWTITTLNFNHFFFFLGGGGICVLWTISILLIFFSDRVMGCSMEDASYWCFRKAVSNSFFQQVLVNIFSTYANWKYRYVVSRLF